MIKSGLQRALWKLKGPHYTIDPRSTDRAVLAMLWDMGLKLLRGSLWRVRFREAKGLIFIGKRVAIRNPEYISAGRNFVAEDECEIQGLSLEGIVLGDNVAVGRYAMIRPSGYYGRELGTGLRVGDNSNIGPYSYIGCYGRIDIGNNVLMGPRVNLFADNHDFSRTDIPIKAQGVTRSHIVIEDDCWLASSCTVLAGVTVHRGAVIAAGSVVTRDVPPYAVVAGVPARVVKWRKPASVREEGARSQNGPDQDSVRSLER